MCKACSANSSCTSVSKSKKVLVRGLAIALMPVEMVQHTEVGVSQCRESRNSGMKENLCPHAQRRRPVRSKRSGERRQQAPGPHLLHACASQPPPVQPQAAQPRQGPRHHLRCVKIRLLPWHREKRAGHVLLCTSVQTLQCSKKVGKLHAGCRMLFDPVLCPRSQAPRLPWLSSRSSALHLCVCAAAVLSGEAEEVAKASVARNSSAAAEAAYHIAATPFKVIIESENCWPFLAAVETRSHPNFKARHGTHCTQTHVSETRNVQTLSRA